MQIEVHLYGALAHYGGDKNNRIHAGIHVEMAAGSRLQDLLVHLELPTEERGITFINCTLSGLPGVQPDLEQILEEGDRVALFHLKSMWPFQYRDGAALTPELARAAKQPYHQRQQPV